jgi:hypothetical protein
MRSSAHRTPHPAAGQPDDGRHAAQHERFREELHDDAPPAGAERGAHDELGLACRRAREHEQPDVGADENEQHDDEHVPGKQGHRLPWPPERPHRLGEREQLWAQILVAAREIGGGHPSEARKLGSRPLERCASGEPAEDPDLHALTRSGSRARDPERNPQLLRAREGEALRHDADDGRRNAGDADCASDDAGIAVKARLPQVVSDHGHRQRACSLVGFRQGASEQRRNSQRAEGRAGHLGGRDRLRQAVRDLQVPRDRAVRRKVVHRLERVAPDDEVVRRAELRTVRGCVPVLEDDDPVALRQRDGGKHELPNRLEGSGADPDRECHGEAAHDREHGVLQQHAAPELHVEPGEAQLVEPSQAACGARLLQMAIRASELGMRLPRCVGG